MCIAIVKPKDKVISKKTLQTCATNNPDGCGFAYIKDDGKILMYKFMNFEKFYEEYEKIQDKSNMLIHFRIATHGEVNLENTHPFKLNHRMALIHNGIISGYGDKKDKSDTRDFIDKVIGNISWKEWKNPSFRKLVGDAIGYSKLCILDVSGEYYIINEHKGEWVDGVWYSNSSYEPRKYTAKVTTTKTAQQKITYTDDDYDYGYGYNYNYGSVDDDYTYQSVYKCEDCGHEFVSNYYYNVKCPKCHKQAKDIGWVENGSKFYYNPEEKKAMAVKKG